MKKINPSYSLLFVIILGLNAVIGAGVFTMPIILFKSAGPASILSIALASISILFVGLGLARVSFLIPEGGFYNYISSWGGNFLGFLASTSYLIGLTCGLGILIKTVGSIISIYFTTVDISYFNYIIILGTFIGTIFASSVARAGQIILFILTILPLIVISALCIKNFSICNFKPLITKGFEGILKGIPSVLFSFLGFEVISSMSRVVKDAKKNIPIATISIILITTLVYIIFVGSIIGSVNPSFFANKTSLSNLLLYAFPKINWIVNFINISMILTILGTVYSLTISLTEMFISSISRINSLNWVPSEIFSAFIVSLGALFFSKYITNITNSFSIIAIFVSSTYFLTTMYLLVKPKNYLDIFLGLLSGAANIILIGAAILQLI